MQKEEEAGRCELCPEERFHICHSILAYFLENPDSGDTEDGVQWWLLDVWIRKYGPHVEAVLRKLVNEGLVLTCVAGDKRIHYRLNQERRQDIQKILDFSLRVRRTPL